MPRLTEALESGFKIGAAGGGRFSAVGKAIKGIAADIKSKRLFKRELAGQKELLREKARLTPPKEKERDIRKDILGLISGIQPAEDIFTPEQITATAPRTLGGRATGGQVLTPPGARFKDGTIFSTGGERIGEYTPGAEPKPFPEAIGGRIGKELGVTKGEATREFLGLPKPSKPTGQITASVAINILSDFRSSRQFKKEFGDEAFEELKNIATGGLGKVSLMKGRSEPINIMDTNF